MHRKLLRPATAIALALAIGGGTAASSSPSNAVIEWNALGTGLLELAPTALVDARTYAIHMAAVHDALNTIVPKYERHTTCRGYPTLPGASPEAAVAQASYETLTALWSANPLAGGDVVAVILERIATRHAHMLAAIKNGPAKQAGIAIGRECALANLEQRHDDGVASAGPPFSAEPAYVPGGNPGDYQFTPPFDAPPNGPFAFAPGWGNVEAFVATVPPNRFNGPDALTSLAYAFDVNYLKAVGRVDSSVRTPEQTEIASFWYELSPSGWNRIADTVLGNRQVGMWKSARTLAVMNFALADGYKTSFTVKYGAPFWRPITAIRLADTDGNPLTTPDPEWTPFCQTPPIPDYPSNHTLLGAAAATVLADALGDRVSFSTTSLTLPGVTRRYRSFSEAAVENGVSRVYCGIHFVRAVVDGYRGGQELGRRATRALEPLR